MTNMNIALARALNDATDFLMKHADLPYIATARTTFGDPIEFQLPSNDNKLPAMATVSRVLQHPVVITSHNQYYDFSITIRHASSDIRVWTHLTLPEAMKLFLRLGLDPDTKVVELDAETLAKAIEPDGGAER